MRLYPLPHSKLENIRPLFNRIHEELPTQPKATVDQSLLSFSRCYENRSAGIYVDDTENPKHCLGLMITPGFSVEGLMVVVLMIYSPPEERGKKEILDAFHLTIDNYASIHGASTIIGSSWKYKGARGIDKMWMSRGYEVQETTYVKLL